MVTRGRRVLTHLHIFPLKMVFSLGNESPTKGSTAEVLLVSWNLRMAPCQSWIHGGNDRISEGALLIGPIGKPMGFTGKTDLRATFAMINWMVWVLCQIAHCPFEALHLWKPVVTTLRLDHSLGWFKGDILQGTLLSADFPLNQCSSTHHRWGNCNPPVMILNLIVYHGLSMFIPADDLAISQSIQS